MSIRRWARIIVRARHATSATETRARRRRRAGGAALGVGLAASLFVAQGAWGGVAGASTRAPVEATRAPATVRLAEVASRVEPAATRLVNLPDLLRADLERALSSIDWGKAGLRKSYLVSASVVRLDSTSEDRKLSASCTVSATLRDAERGTILATLQGRARAEDAATKGERAERDALTAAAQGAVDAIPEAIRRAE